MQEPHSLIHSQKESLFLYLQSKLKQNTADSCMLLTVQTDLLSQQPSAHTNLDKLKGKPLMEYSVDLGTSRQVLS